ncbi:uncharacterized protein TM35_000142570 [Trypanosoma theileri]|uniref:Uncharacterized protein n=1 Tax=Trypanosoma theileri TaxID=67003 RepID=A0A1X0NWG4_9TRYP|nr:uncharacterized protein TM35_000142570 [Trypanosoma theileri]ORC89046.1 hypothetical protein TM35_000142570 [Trypanosoma theileri]
MRTQVTSTSVVSIVFRCSVLAAVLCTSLVAQAYSVRYVTFTSPTPVSARFAGPCPWQSGGHTMMPMTGSFQTDAYSKFVGAAYTEAPIGGINPATSCTTQRCPWIFHTGLMNGTPVKQSTFLYGTVHNGVDHTVIVPGMYHNFINGVQPVSFLSPEDNVIPKMRQGGLWMTDLRDHLYTTWICEYYDFTASEEATAPATDENGFLLHPYIIGGFPWWAGLIIGIVVVIIVVIILIICCCCCKKHKEKLEEEEIAEDTRMEDNLSRIPTQSQLGFGRSRSSAYVGNDRGDFQGSGYAGVGRNGSVYNNNNYVENDAIDGGNPLEGQYPAEDYQYNNNYQGGYPPGGYVPQGGYPANYGYPPQAGY